MMMMVSGLMFSIGECRVAVLPLVVFKCGSPIAILPRRQHMLGYVDVSTGIRIILECFLRLFGGKGWRGGIVDGHLLLKRHFCEGKAWAVEWVGGSWKMEEERWVEWLLEDMNAIITEVNRRLADCICIC